MHAGYVYAISIRLLADPEDANENTSKIFIEAWNTISMVRRDSPFILWLKAIASYSSLQRIRQKDKDKTDGNKKTPDQKGLGFLDQAITTLPESERIVFVLSDIENYQTQEISDLLSMTLEEVKNFLVSARALLTKILVVKSNEALERAIKQLPESIEPNENLYNRIIADISIKNIPDKTEGPEVVQDRDDEINDNQSKQEKKRFSFKDFFRKKE